MQVAAINLTEEACIKTLYRNTKNLKEYNKQQTLRAEGVKMGAQAHKMTQNLAVSWFHVTPKATHEARLKALERR